MRLRRLMITGVLAGALVAGPVTTSLVPSAFADSGRGRDGDKNKDHKDDKNSGKGSAAHRRGNDGDHDDDDDDDDDRRRTRTSGLANVVVPLQSVTPIPTVVTTIVGTVPPATVLNPTPVPVSLARTCDSVRRDARRLADRIEHKNKDAAHDEARAHAALRKGNQKKANRLFAEAAVTRAEVSRLTASRLALVAGCPSAF